MSPALLILAQQLPIRWQSPWLLPAVLGVGAAVAAAVLWLYPQQVRRVRAPWRYVIPGLRLLAFTALAVSIAKPVALRARPADDRGVLVVLVDRSRSMSIADRGRKPGELVAVADALGLLPAGARAAAAADVAGAYERLQSAVDQAARAQGDLDYARVSGRGVESAEARVRKALGEAREIGQALAKREADLPPGVGLKGKLAPLGDLPAPADLRGGWVPEARQRLAAAAAAIGLYQDRADRRLYDADPAVRGVCDALAGRTRFELAAEALVRPGGLLSRLGPETQVLVFGFAGDVTPAGGVSPAPPSATQPAAGARPSPSGVLDPDPSPPASPAVIWTSDRLPLKVEGPDAASASGSDVAGAVAAALAAADGRPVRGVLVISDGQQVGREASRAAAAALPPGVPLIAVAAAGAAAPDDLSVADVLVPDGAFAGETVSVRARLRSTGGAPLDPSTARLTAAGRPGGGDDLPPTAVERSASRKDESVAWVQFAVRFDEPGVHEVVVALPPVDGEASVENNAARRWVKVLPERIRVGAYAGSPMWDFQHLRGALVRREWFAVESGVLDPANPKLPLTPAQILRQDVLVLYDLPPAALDANQWSAVEQMVARRGGSVMFVAGPSFVPADYLAKQPVAAGLLPFDFGAEAKPEWRGPKGDRPGVKLVPPPELAKSDLLRLDDADANNRRYYDLPGVYRLLPVAKPKPAVRALLREEQANQAVVTEMPREAGRAFYVGTPETWRWRTRGGEAEHERFWRQLVRHAAEAPYAARSGRLALDVDRVAVRAGATVNVRARVLEPDDEPAAATRPAEGPPPAESLVVEVLDAAAADRVVRTVKPREVADGGGRLVAALADLPPGDYAVRLSSPAAPAPAAGWPRVRLHVDGNGEDEMRNLAGDPDRLKRMAESSGGRLLQIQQLSAVPGLLANAADDRPRFVEWRLWDSPWLFAFVVACLGAEWALRKRAGLA